jgi:outer membrane protein TolC
MKKKKIISLLLFASVLVFSSGSAVMAQDNTLDVEKAAIMAINSSQSLQTMDKKIKLQTQSTQAAADAARSALASGRGDGESLVETIVLAPLKTDNALKQMSNSKEVSVNTLRLSAYSMYIKLLEANYKANIQKELVDNLKSDYDMAQMQLSQGLITSNDERLDEIKYSQAVYTYNSYEKALDSVYMAVNNLTGVDINTRYSSLIDNNVIPATQIRRLNDYETDALNNRIEIVNAQNTLDTDQKEYDFARSHPQVDYPWFIQQQEEAIAIDQNNLEIAKLNVQLDITKAYKNLESSMNALQVQQANCDLAEANYKSAQVQYNNVSITLNQLESAQIAEANAKMNLKNAQLSAWLMQMTMNSACGVGPATNLQ